MIQGKVAKVLSSEEIVINKGSVDRVQIGMVFDVRDDRLDEIIDPDSGESLGSIEGPEVSYEITRIGPRASLARRYKRDPLNEMLRGYSSRSGGAFGRAQTRDVVRVGDPAIHDGTMTRLGLYLK